MPDELDDLLEIPPKRDEPKDQTPPVEPAPVQAAPQAAAPEPTPITVDPFDARQVEAAPILEDFEITYSPSRVSNYSALKNFAKYFKFQAWVQGLGGIAAVIYSIQFYDDNWRRIDPEFWFFLIIGLSALLGVIPIILVAENINLKLDIEANTRQAAKTLERILKSQ